MQNKAGIPTSMLPNYKLIRVLFENAAKLFYKTNWQKMKMG